MTFFADFERSHGNYVVDADGNVLMDLFNQIGSLALGYSHPAIKVALSSEANLASLVTRPALAMFPPSSWPEMVQSTLMPVSERPPSLSLTHPPPLTPSWPQLV